MKVHVAVMALCAALASAPRALGHGYLSTPEARNGKQTAGSGGGYKDNVLQADKSTEAFIAGPCGDPFVTSQDRVPEGGFINDPGEPTVVYQQGETIDLEVRITNNHGGYFTFRLCDEEELTHECFRNNILERADVAGETKWFILEGKGGDPRPEDPDVYTMQYKLPADFTCESCVLQWSWKVLALCYETDCDEEICGSYKNYESPMLEIKGKTGRAVECEEENDSFGQAQFFVNCADISIEGDASTDESRGFTD